MKKAEKGLIVLFLIGLLLRFFHLPLNSLLLILSMSSLALLYMYFGFAFFNGIKLRKIFKKQSYRGVSASRIFTAIVAGFGLSVAVMGILFKLSLWPGASVQLLTGLAVLSIVTMFSFFKLTSDSDGYYLNVLKRTVPLVAICITLVYIPTQIWLELRYPNNPEYVKALLEAEANPGNLELWEKVDEERDKMMEEKNKY